MEFHQYSPHPRLAGHVECYWHLRTGPCAGTPPERVLPDGCMELILNLRTPFCQADQAGCYQRQPTAFLVGQITRFVLLRATAEAEVLAVRFKPGGAHALFGIDMHELTDRCVPLDQIGSPWMDLSARVGGCKTIAAALREIESTLGQRLAVSSTHGRRINAVLGILREAESPARISIVAREVGVSPRQLERTFLREVGVGPKHFARLLRFRRMLTAMDGGDTHWADLAARTGYSDQPHLVREFREFAGLAPREFLANRTPFASALIG